MRTMVLSSCVFLVASLLCGSEAARATDAQGNFKIYYLNNGGDSCGAFIAAREEARRGDQRDENQYRVWLAGFLTGFNVASPNTYDLGGSTDLSSMLVWLENRCKRDPLTPFTDLVQNLATELSAKRKTHKDSIQ